MTVLAHDAAMYGLTVDTWRLYTGDDPEYELWLRGVTSMLHNSYRAAQSKN